MDHNEAHGLVLGLLGYNDEAQTLNISVCFQSRVGVFSAKTFCFFIT